MVVIDAPSTHCPVLDVLIQRPLQAPGRGKGCLVLREQVPGINWAETI